jgi:leucyl-tRNA synthetase
MVQGKTYKDNNGHYYLKDNCIVGDQEIKTADGVQITVSYEKMSKSKGNGVDPIVSLL